MKRILVIAGSDSSGGAGLEADQKVIAAHGCYAMTATTALTAQNTQGVSDVYEIPSAFVEKQIASCVEDVGVDVVKTGMLASANTIRMVANAFRKHELRLSIVDPVMVATTGAELLPETAVKTLCDELLPYTYLLTPNVPEARLLLRESGQPQMDIVDLNDLIDLAASVQKLGPKHVLLKGGHTPFTSGGKVAKSGSEKEYIVNVLVVDGQVMHFRFPYQPSRNTHGTGCSLASAIACNLALENDMVTAVKHACRYVDAGISTSIGLGKGSGPINHFHSLQVLPFAPGHFVDYVLERQDVQEVWHEYTHHEFVKKMSDGTLPLDSFKQYMIQDYLYLIHFARANSLAGYKTKSLDDIASAAEIVTHIRKEINLHIQECHDFGITREEIEQNEESQACTAYSRYVLDIGQSEDWLALQISLLPCLLGYGVIGRRLLEEQQHNPPNEPNRYRKWIDNYTADDYTKAVEKGRALMEKHASKQSPTRIEELVKIFVHATRMEAGFWDMASTK